MEVGYSAGQGAPSISHLAPGQGGPGVGSTSWRRVRIVWDGVNVAAAHILARFSTLIVHYNALLLCTSFRRCQSGNALVNRLQGPDQKFGSGRPPPLSAKSLNGP